MMKQVHVQQDETHPSNQATLGGGCFWCLEAIFQQLRGVEDVIPGYAGGHVGQPSYRQVCTGRTGHAEVVRITFDSDVVSYQDLLVVFFTMHDPTTPNRQGADIGPQYRSIILTHDERQHRVARDVRDACERGDLWKNPIVTEIVPLEAFHPAEDEHVNYYRNHARLPYCRMVIAPKIAQLRRKHLDRLAK